MAGAVKKRKRCGCQAVLVVHADTFKNMKVTGQTLKKRSKYVPQSEDRCHRDLNAQNQWLLSNVFDASGNFLYCSGCITKILGVNNKRLTRLRKQKLEGKTTPSHGATGKTSNRALTTTRDQFIHFMDCNRMPNGRQIGSASAAYFFDPIYDSFREPDKGNPHYDIKVKRSVVAQFNRSQVEAGLPVISNKSAQDWRAQHRKDTIICPPKTDY